MSTLKKVVFLSNYFNHHQRFLAEEFYRLLGDGYTFVETIPMEEKRKALGWCQYEEPYLLRSYESSENYEKAMRLIFEADAVIFGSAPEGMIKKRIRKGKLVFRYSERFLRNGWELKKFLYRMLRFHLINPPGKSVHLLCASAYTAADYRKFFLFRTRAYRWGYFTEAKRYEEIDALIAEKDSNEILWCGRFLELKHLDDAVAAIGRLAKEGYPCHLKVIGNGEKEKAIRDQIKELGYEERVQFLGIVPSDEVRRVMEKAGIYLFTSDFREGWGAVVNEAMNSACAVVSSHAAGVTPFLIQNGENGYIYQSGNVEELYQRIKYLLDHKEEQRRTGKNAYRTITERWSPAVAAKRFVELAEAILDGKTVAFGDGPASPAPILKNSWYPEKETENE